jgi:hypothetical protein
MRVVPRRGENALMSLLQNSLGKSIGRLHTIRACELVWLITWKTIKTLSVPVFNCFRIAGGILDKGFYSVSAWRKRKTISRPRRIITMVDTINTTSTQNIFSIKSDHYIWHTALSDEPHTAGPSAPPAARWIPHLRPLCTSSSIWLSFSGQRNCKIGETGSHLIVFYSGLRSGDNLRLGCRNKILYMYLFFSNRCGKMGLPSRSLPSCGFGRSQPAWHHSDFVDCRCVCFHVNFFHIRE